MVTGVQPEQRHKAMYTEVHGKEKAVLTVPSGGEFTTRIIVNYRHSKLYARRIHVHKHVFRQTCV